LFAGLLAVMVLGATCLSAADIEPRAYSNIPFGINFLVVGYAYSEGDVNFDPSVPIENAKLTLHSSFLAYARSLDLWGNEILATTFTTMLDPVVAKFDVSLVGHESSARVGNYLALGFEPVKNVVTGDPDGNQARNFLYWLLLGVDGAAVCRGRNESRLDRTAFVAGAWRETSAQTLAFGAGSGWPTAGLGRMDFNGVGLAK
jgi:hypothetical protein